MGESLSQYLETKRIFKFRGKSYYKVKNYKVSYYIDTQVFDMLNKGTQEVTLETNSSAKPQKGMIKWDVSQKKILISETKIRIYYQPYDVE